MTKQARLATCTTMVFTDGRNSTYAVMVGPMRGKGFRSDQADIVATYNVSGKPDYRAMTAAHATAEAPAVYWQSPAAPEDSGAPKGWDEAPAP